MKSWSCNRTTAALAALAWMLAGSMPASAGLIGNDDKSGMLYDVSPLTGTISDPRATGITGLVGIAASPGGDLYGLTSFGGGPTPDALYRIDPTTGASSLIGATGLKSIFEGDLAFDPATGVLYGVQNATSNGLGLFTMNVSTGAATLIGNVERFGDLSDIAFDKSGNLFLLDDDQNGISNLLEVNKSTASIINTVRLSLNLGPVGGMTFDPSSGRLYVVDGTDGPYTGTNSLYALNTTTGDLALIGNTGLSAGLAGLTFSTSAVPEPASGSLLGLGCLVLLFVVHRSAAKAVPRPFT